MRFGSLGLDSNGIIIQRQIPSLFNTLMLLILNLCIFVYYLYNYMHNLHYLIYIYGNPSLQQVYQLGLTLFISDWTHATLI